MRKTEEDDNHYRVRHWKGGRQAGSVCVWILIHCEQETCSMQPAAGAHAQTSTEKKNAAGDHQRLREMQSTNQDVFL